MRPIIAAFFALLLPLAHAAETPRECAECKTILQDIRATLESNCDQIPSDVELRQQPIYLFLSIFGEVSQGVDKAMQKRIYAAALAGMECDNLSAGVAAAQKMSRQVMSESRS